MRSEAGDEGIARLMGLVTAGSLSMAVCVAADLRIADLLADGPRDTDALARETGCNAQALLRLMRALCSLDLCEQQGASSFALKASGHLLRSHAPRSLRSWMLWWGKYMWPVWGQLMHSIRTGKSARRLVTGADDFGHLGRDKEAATVFNGAMAEFTALVAEEIVRCYDFRDAGRIVDVGGGHGALIAAMLCAHPSARGVLVDLAHAIPGAQAWLRKTCVEARCELVEGDFFRAVPQGGDLYLLKAILHDWDDERCGSILANCRRAIRPEGRLAIIERVMPQSVRASSREAALARADLNMLVALGGRERSEPEFFGLLRAAGFRLCRIIETPLEYSIIEATPV